MLIHARNVTGLGASQVVRSLIKALIKEMQDKKIIFALPVQGELSVLEGVESKICVKSMLPNALFRVIECLFPRLFYPKMKHNLILGDIPLRGLKDQIVLVHQSNLTNPNINPNSSRSMLFKIMRKIFEWNLKDVACVVVQSDVMKDELLKSYPVLGERTVVIPQPAPDWFLKPELNTSIDKEGLCLFYPAANYPHKNHRFIAKLDREGGLDRLEKLIVTLQNEEWIEGLSEQSKIQNAGRLAPQACIDYYQHVDALFFPSLAESYGLPLVEAMMSGLPILCSDLPYARWMCEEGAIYFDPTSVESVKAAIKDLESRLGKGWRPDWRKALSKLPSDWSDVAQAFVRLMK